jgi:hypothetical protein
LASVIETGTRSNVASALAVAVMEILLRSRLVAVINLLFRIDLQRVSAALVLVRVRVERTVVVSKTS